MSKLTKNEEIFMERAAAELLKAHPEMTVDTEVTQKMMIGAFEAVLKRDQELLKLASENEELQGYVGLSVYNAARIEGLKDDHKRQLNDERIAGNVRSANFLMQ